MKKLKSDRIKIAIVEDHQLFRSAVKLVLERKLSLQKNDQENISLIEIL